jgi:hypothetical protein
MGTRYAQLSLEDRCEIARLQANGCSIRQIAAALDRAPSTISRELKRNYGRQVGYGPAYAQQQARARLPNFPAKRQSPPKTGDKFFGFLAAFRHFQFSARFLASPTVNHPRNSLWRFFSLPSKARPPLLKKITRTYPRRPRRW